jgi:hypothetical protein
MGKYGRTKEDFQIKLHNYTTVYHSLLNPIRYEKLKIFELGLSITSCPIKYGSYWSSHGFGSRMEDIPNSEIFGADIDVDILKMKKIKTYYCDQLNPDDKEYVE